MGTKKKIKTTPPAAFSPEADCCHRENPEQNHAADCANAAPAAAPQDPAPNSVAAQEPEPERPRAPLTEAERIAESRKALEHPLAAGQAFFEAPDGFIIIAEASRGHVLYKGGNDGKGMLINPMRVGNPKGLSKQAE